MTAAAPAVLGSMVREWPNQLSTVEAPADRFEWTKVIMRGWIGIAVDYPFLGELARVIVELYRMAMTIFGRCEPNLTHPQVGMVSGTWHCQRLNQKSWAV